MAHRIGPTCVRCWVCCVREKSRLVVGGESPTLSTISARSNVPQHERSSARLHLPNSGTEGPWLRPWRCGAVQGVDNV
jgi:hypothetical protein